MEQSLGLLFTKPAKEGMMGHLDVRLLGPFQVTLDGQPVTGFRSDKVRALLAYLCTEADGPHRREKLAGMFWPDWPESSARANLRRALADLRVVISDQETTPPSLSVTRQTIAFNTASDAWVDVLAFADLAGPGGRGPEQDPSALEQAAGLYRGEFLEGFSLPDSAPFEEWALFHRERFHRMVLEALERLVQQYGQAGQYERGLDHAWRQVALDPWREEAHRQLMLLLAATGQRSAALAQYETCRQVLAQELGTEPSAGLRQTYERLLRGERLPDLPFAPAKEGREPRQVGPCPYRGLAAFREEDAPFFFGRETFTQRLVEAVQGQPLVAVIVGSSGCGKSSAVFAGLLPRLRDADGWLIAAIRPGAEPFRALAGALLPILSPELDDTDRLLQAHKMSEALSAGDLPLADVVALALEKQPSAQRLLLVVDQFEELYTLCPDSEVRRRLVDSLLQAVASAGKGRVPRTVLLLTIRADFMGQALAHRPFADALQEATVMLGPMNRDELHAAITEPAEVQGAAFESGLVERILDDVGEEPGNLPLLEFALTLLWERHRQGWLTHQGYEATGRVEGALARYADQVYTRLDEAEQESTRQVFVQLVHPGEGTEDTRRLATRAEVGEENWGLVQHLADRRLVVTGRDAAGVETVEVVHEALIGSWGELQAWMEEDRAFRTWQERLRTAVRQWERTGQDEGALLRGAPLAEAEGWLAERGEELGEGERSFIRAGVALRERRAAEREAQRQRELEAAQALAAEQERRADAERRRAEEQAESAGRLRRRALLLAGAMVAAIILAGLAFVAFRQADQNASAAEVASTRAVSERYAAETAQAEEADQRATAEAEGWARATQQAVAEEQRAVAEAEAEARATQQAVAVAEAEARATQQAVAEEQRAVAEEQTHLATSRELANAAIASLDEDPERSALLALEALDAADTLEARNALRRALPEMRVLHTLPVPAGGGTGVAFSPDGTLLAAAVPKGVTVWDATSGEELFLLERPLWGHPRVTFSPDGPRLFASGETDLYAWEMATTDTGAVTATNPITVSGYLTKTSGEFTIGVNFMSFSPDGQRMAVAHWKGAPTVFDTATLTETLRLEGHAVNCRDVAFSPDGRLLATAGDDLTVRVWDAETGQELLNLSVPNPRVYSVDWSPDGSRLVAADEFGVMIVWDPLTGEKLLTKSSGVAGFFGVSFADNGRSLVTPMTDGTVRVWDAETGDLLKTYAGHMGSVQDVAISPDGTLLATAGTDSTVRLWTTGPVGELNAFSLGPGAGLAAVDYSPDGKQVATNSAAGPAVWDPLTGEPVLALPQADESEGSYALAYSPDGTRLAAGTHSGPIHIWDLASAEHVQTLMGHRFMVADLVFSPDGQRLASVGWDGLAAVWDLASGQAMTLTLNPELPSLFSASFSPDGSQVATASPMEALEHGGVSGIHVWDAVTGTALDTIPIDATAIYSVRYSPDGELFAAGVQEGDVLLYDVSSRQLVRRLSGHTGLVWRLAFSPDGKVLTSVSHDMTVKVWDVDTGVELATLDPGTTFLNGQALSPDGRRVATASVEGTVHIFALSTEELAEVARSRVTRSLTTLECQKYLHLEACPERP
jgi:WD40 repeat protein/DNA-binding SARP family transcriptional activator